MRLSASNLLITSDTKSMYGIVSTPVTTPVGLFNFLFGFYY
jgi:hypothetical protein